MSESGPVPLPLEHFIKIFGVAFDRHLTFDSHFAVTLAKYRIRQGISARVARSTWVLEISVLSATHDAIATSLLRYGVATLGSGMPEDLITKMDVQIINTAARRIS